MLPTFVIGLREGLEASLIVGIVAAFLRQRGRTDLLRWVLLGILAAVALCTVAGVALDVLSRSLPQRQQEGLETVIGLVAVAMVTYMVVWMKRHSRELKGQLDRAAGVALAAGSGLALVAMAFLAVLREGLETVVFLLAAFNESGSGSTAAAGALLGIAVSVGLGYGIYRGGVRLNLSRFFRATGVVLVLVAAGLVVTALHTAHEAGWLDVGQQSTVDLSGLVAPGSVRASLLTGMLGLQSQPVLIEVVGWLLYLVPVGLYVAWPPGRAPSRLLVQRTAAGAAAIAAVGAVTLAGLAPSAPAQPPATAGGGLSARLLSPPAERAVVRVDGRTLTATRTGHETSHGVPTAVYRATVAGTPAGPAALPLRRLAELNGGRLPLGASPAGGTAGGAGSVPVTRTSAAAVTLWVDSVTGRVVDLRWDRQTTLVAHFATGASPIGRAGTTTTRLPETAAVAAAAAARADSGTLDNRNLLRSLAVLHAVGASALLATAGAAGFLGARQRRTGSTTAPRPRVGVSAR